jgi:hypothetical protein
MAAPMPPVWHGEATRFLVSRSPGEFNVMPVDRDGSCAGQHHVTPQWHRYHTFAPLAESRPVQMAIRCPNSLSPKEWERVFGTYTEAREWGKKNPLPKVKTEPTTITPNYDSDGSWK